MDLQKFQLDLVMANHWDSEYAIWRDLSVAQGREVPAQIDNTVAKDEKPPRLLLTEETEEEFYGNYVGAGDNNCAPDLKLIQMMLQEVSKPTAEESSETVIDKIKPTRKKNLAIESILQMYDKNSSEVFKNGHFRAEPSTSQLAVVPVLDTAVMFKKKTKGSSRSSEDSPQSVKSDSDVEQPRMFVPSSRAAEYYTKYREQHQARERANEDIWSRAQREMEELDKKRKMNAVSPCSSTSSEKPAQGMDLVRLSTHRHSFTDTKDCIVCKVLCSRTEITPPETEPK